jgi:hypothetical protein
MRIKRFKSFNQDLVDKELVKRTSDGIIRFLRDNKISTWEEMDNNEFTRNTINKIIDKAARTYEEVKEIKFFMKLELSSIKSLKNLLQDLIESEEYEKCRLVQNRINQIEESSYF